MNNDSGISGKAGAIQSVFENNLEDIQSAMDQELSLFFVQRIGV
jgi:hypothetical protein